MELFKTDSAPAQADNKPALIVSTQIYKGRDGWEAQSMSRTDASGKAWQINTHKISGGIKCYAIQGEDNGSTFSYMMMGGKRLELGKVEGMCNEKKVRELHAVGLIKFEEEMSKTTEGTKPAYILGIGHKIFTWHMGRCRERVIFEIIRPGKFKSVLIDKTGFEYDEHVRPYTEKFGIGVYYNEGEIMPAEELETLLQEARSAETSRNEAAQAAAIEAANYKAKALAEGAKIIAEIPKNAVCVIVAEKRVNESDLQSDYHAHSTEEVVYLAFSTHKRDLFAEMRKAAENSPIEEINKYATAPTTNRNGQPQTEENKDYWHPADEHREKYSMGEGYYLGDSAYSGWIIKKTNLSQNANDYGVTLEKLQIAAAENRYFVKEADEATAEPVEVPAGKVQIIDYSEKAIAVIGDTKPIKDTLKALGGRFNFRLSCGAGWIFPKTKLEEIKKALQAPSAQPEEPTTEEPVKDWRRHPELEQAHPLNLCDPSGGQYKQALKEYEEEQRRYSEIAA